MIIKQIKRRGSIYGHENLRSVQQSPNDPHQVGHSQFGVHGISRRQFMGTTVAGLAASRVALGSGRFRAVSGDAPGPGMPNPIPHVFTNAFGSFHFFFPGPVEGTAAPTDPTGVHPGRDPSTITDFNGFIGGADLKLTGIGTDTTTNTTAPYSFHTDMRFMKGEFIGTDGRNHRGAFAFI